MTDEPLTAYAVRISRTASAQAVAEYDRLSQSVGTDAAEAWRTGLLASWAGLATLPLRCPVAPEDTLFQSFRPGPPLRVLLHGRRRSAWRIFFTAHDATADDPPVVQVHLLRHGAQAPLTEWPEEDAA